VAKIPNMEEEESEYQTRVDVCLTKEEHATHADERIDYQATLDAEAEDDNTIYPSNIRSIEFQEEIAPEIKRETNTGANLGTKKSPPASLNEYRIKYGLQLDDVEEEQDNYTTQNGETRKESKKIIKDDLKRPASMDVDRSVIIPQQEQNDEEDDEKKFESSGISLV